MAGDKKIVDGDRRPAVLHVASRAKVGKEKGMKLHQHKKGKETSFNQGEATLALVAYPELGWLTMYGSKLFIMVLTAACWNFSRRCVAFCATREAGGHARHMPFVGDQELYLSSQEEGEVKL